VNLELTGLPEGWIGHIMAIEYAKPTIDRRLASDDAGTSSETNNSECFNEPRASLRRQSSLEIFDKSSPLSTRAKTDMKIQYINYWTGETQELSPKNQAPTKLLFIAPKIIKQDNTMDDNTPIIDEKYPSKKNSLNLRQFSLDDRAMTERSSSVRTTPIVSAEKRVRRCTPCSIS